MRIPIIRGIIDRRLLVNWRVEPDIRHTSRLGQAQIDCALLMRNIEHDWHASGKLASAASAAR